MTPNSPTRWGATLALIGLLFVLTGCPPLPYHAAENPIPRPRARADASPPQRATPEAPIRCFVASVTTQGAECPAVRTSTGRLVTLLPKGVLGGAPAGDKVCLCGRALDGPSICQQGTTIRVTNVSEPGSCGQLRQRFSERR